jgi:hypothetical protein
LVSLSSIALEVAAKKVEQLAELQEPNEIV